MLFVGINPGVRSAETGHHFAGYSNRFWKLLWEARLVPEPITYGTTAGCPSSASASPISSRGRRRASTRSKPAEYVAGWKVLERKIKKFKPSVVALVGVTLWRAILPLLPTSDEETRTI